MSLINIENLTFAYDGSYYNIFENVSFQIDTDWRLGFCGRNGRGKTTFLKLLMGEYEYSGVISSGTQFDYFPYPVEDASLNTLEILQSIAKAAQTWQIQKELAKLAVDEDALYRPFETLSSGERTKILLAGLFLRGHNFLLIDEPTNHLDMTAREIVARYLNSKSGFILVSHDRAFLDACVNHVLSINRANIEIQQGSFSSWFLNKERRDNYELAENQKLKSEIKRLEKTAREKAEWSDKKHESSQHDFFRAEAARVMKRSKTIEGRRQRAIEEKSALLKNIEATDSLKIHPLKYRSDRLLSFDNVSIFYGEKTVCRDVSFTLNQGDRLAISGGNGSGKSSILKLIRGEDIAFTGNVNIGSRLIISYVPQDASFLTGDLRDYAETAGVDESLFKAILRKLDFSRGQFEKDMADFSAGQKKKVLLARSLCDSAHVYIWDEPLNYIDVLSRIQVEELITAYQPTMIFVEHDRAFQDNIATKIVTL
ncbi:MAG: ABC-F type ribosomal protection protein [Oscillospiraceae bacterium]|nr:ABC-F type ribosomal protection protein [Oscillospiraceae bacterium]